MEFIAKQDGSLSYRRHIFALEQLNPWRHHPPCLSILDRADSVTDGTQSTLVLSADRPRLEIVLPILCGASLVQVCVEVVKDTLTSNVVSEDLLLAPYGALCKSESVDLTTLGRKLTNAKSKQRFIVRIVLLMLLMLLLLLLLLIAVCW